MKKIIEILLSTLKLRCCIKKKRSLYRIANALNVLPLTKMANQKITFKAMETIQAVDPSKKYMAGQSRPFLVKRRRSEAGKGHVSKQDDSM